MAEKKIKEKKAPKEESVAKAKAGRQIKLHGRVLQGVVVSDKAAKTVTVERSRRYFLKKFDRYEMRRTKVLAHNPPEVNAKMGDIVRIKETRPLSKRKHFVVIEVIEKK